MNSIEEIFDNNNQLIDGIHHFFDRYIGNSLLRKCGINKIVDKIMSKGYEYPDSPLPRLLGKNPKDSPILQKVVKAKDLLIDKILLCFASGSAYRIMSGKKYCGILF